MRLGPTLDGEIKKKRLLIFGNRSTKNKFDMKCSFCEQAVHLVILEEAIFEVRFENPGNYVARLWGGNDNSRGRTDRTN